MSVTKYENIICRLSSFQRFKLNFNLLNIIYVSLLLLSNLKYNFKSS